MLFLSFFERMPMHEIAENTVVAQGVCPVAKAGLHLQQTLLCGHAPQAEAPHPEQPLPDES